MLLVGFMFDLSLLFNNGWHLNLSVVVVTHSGVHAQLAVRLLPLHRLFKAILDLSLLVAQLTHLLQRGSWRFMRIHIDL